MAWELGKTYYYLVCFATLMMMIIGSVGIVEAGLDLVLRPNEGYPDRYELYRQHVEMRSDGESVPTQEEIDEMLAERTEHNLRRARRNQIRRMCVHIALVLIAAPLYSYHWKRVRNA